MSLKFIQLTTEAGTAVEIQRPNNETVVVTPYSQALTFHFPFAQWVWNRPVAVELHEGGSRRRLPVQDTTRILQVALLSLSFLFSGVTIHQLISKRKA